jgi:hypothetical protein
MELPEPRKRLLRGSFQLYPRETFAAAAKIEFWRAAASWRRRSIPDVIVVAAVTMTEPRLIER